MLKQLLALFAFALLAGPSLFSQVTTATIAGIVSDEGGAPLAGVTIVATHTPSGTIYGTFTRGDGRYTLPNLRVGGHFKCFHPRNCREWNLQ